MNNTNTMKTTLHKAGSRGHANHGWLNSYHTFSFGHYYNADRMHFGALRVVNDDTVSAGMGFGKHPHDNMEIISIPTYGDLKHNDSMGNETIIRQGDIQVMSAGTGLAHSEMNANRDKEVRFFQIWVFPNKRNVAPRYDQQKIDESRMQNQWLQVLSPNADDDGVWIHQDAWFHMTDLEAGKTLQYNLKNPANGVYAFVIEGAATIAGNLLEKRDGLGIEQTDSFDVTANENARILLMEVPMIK